MTEEDLHRLERCVALAEEALEQGGAPFGSILVAADGRVLREERNETESGDATRHPEFALARWAAENLDPDERRSATVYTSGEHCAMCAAAHAWVGLGPIVYASSTAQLVAWMSEAGAPPLPIRPLRITEVAPDIDVSGPAPGLAERVRTLHDRQRG